MLWEDKTAGRQIPTLLSYFLWTRQCKQNLCQQGCAATRHGELLRAVYVWHTEHQDLVDIRFCVTYGSWRSDNHENNSTVATLTDRSTKTYHAVQSSILLILPSYVFTTSKCFKQKLKYKQIYILSVILCTAEQFYTNFKIGFMQNSTYKDYLLTTKKNRGPHIKAVLALKSSNWENA
jgi:hypothetical protein